MYMLFHRKDMMGDPEMRLVEYLYKGNKTSTVLLIGESFTVKRQEIITTIIRTEDNGFKGGSADGKHMENSGFLVKPAKFLW